MRKLLKKLRKQRGAALVEYGLLVALIAVGAITAISGTGDAVDQGFTAVCNELNESDDVDVTCED
ncbi:hypothetical protein R50073_35910 [Maricurvus nonylphenolicus]|uniref:Flp family type IVb pilin n=1 Tax=Maricurvus nonylphenolicus TaxID=1008307 RepID=UPI0036F3DB46